MTRRVAFYIDSLKTGGAERVTLRMAVWCLEAGLDPLLLTHRSPTADFYPVPAGIERHVESPDAAWLARLGWLGFPWRVLALRRWLIRNRIDTAIGMTTLPGIKLLLAARNLPLACWVSERNYPPAKRPSLPWRLLRWLTYRWADLHLVQTAQTGDWLRRRLRATPQLLLPNSIVWPLPSFAPLVEPAALLKRSAAGGQADFADRPEFLLAVGTKAFQKGFDRLVRAFALLAPALPQLHLVIAGLGEGDYHGLDQRAALKGLLNPTSSALARLHFPGVVGNIGDWYAACQMFILPSRYEGFPNVLLEAMASGCACVAFDCCTGPADLIRDGENGLLLPATATDQALADAILALHRNADRRRRLAQQARAVRDQFSDARLSRRFIEALDG
ncbi:glycosyltransferase [Synechococcus sp. CS-1325]|uniref:glycosyltransferase n=1 Tax=unclassified Synechococcus TaxID=2626047 RepID=UPI000DB66441|nr:MULTISPECIES: glycosyltransferase [unclassified Synechococcus]MCT0198466.1 glycosyltransferase [Synechococcus sp. CS-1325]MCT0213586.1 glycosyltransferase [Synechococcus sp. CS-1326]MCT0232177.1 glycosyltransferase [Synechococcus sp. CS-1327]PZV01742.1 MAG: glycosyl transferase [Cyanobium sp.]